MQISSSSWKVFDSCNISPVSTTHFKKIYNKVVLLKLGISIARINFVVSSCNLSKNILSFTFSYHLNGRIANVCDFIDVKVFDKLLGKISEAKNIVKSTKTPSLPLWIGEAADAYGGVARNISDTYVSGFL